MNMETNVSHAHVHAREASPGWLVVRTKSAREGQATEELRQAGMHPYCPGYQREYRHHRSKKWIVREFPLFKGYLFLPSEGVNWYGLADCKAVASILRSAGGNPLLVSDSVVEAVREKQAAGEFDELKVHGHMVKVGQTVKVAEGALTGMAGLVCSVASAKNVRLLLSMFGREVQTTAALEKLKRA